MPSSKNFDDRVPSVRTDVLITLVGLSAIVIALIFYSRAFPSAALDLTLSRDQIAPRAQAYLASQGISVDGYDSIVTFAQDFWGSIFLQRTLGVEETNRRTSAERLPLWYWQARYFMPKQKEEFSVQLATDGRVVGFTHTLLEDAPGARQTQEQARAQAEAYLTRDRGWTLDDWELVSASSQEQHGGRMDHHFVWRHRDFKAGDGELRLSVDVQGDRVDGYNYYLHVPEAFTRDFSSAHDASNFVSNICYLFGFLGIGAVAAAIALMGLARGIYPSRAAMGVAVAVGIVMALFALNVLPLAKSWYDTTQDYAIFWIRQIIGYAFDGAFYVVGIVMVWMGGQRLSKSVWRYKDKILPRGEHRWEIFARSTWRGVMLGCIWGGYVVVFYLVATAVFGGWTPLETPYTDWYATPFPFLAPLAVGLLPATTEELVFRLAGIPLFLALTRNRMLALLIPGAIWAFAHLGYITDPVYLRGIELTLSSFFFAGLFFWKFDLTTTITAHFAYNAGLTALPLLHSDNPHFVASGLIVIAIMLAPTVPGLVSVALRRWHREVAPPPNIGIGPAMRGDAGALAQLGNPPIDWNTYLQNGSNVVLCLRADDRMVGVAAGAVHEGAAQVETLYIAPAWRRRFWGTRLADELGECLHARGANTVHALAATSDHVATSFWASLDWAASARTFTRSFAAEPKRGWRAWIAARSVHLRI